MKRRHRELGFATWFRAFGVILILLCHFTAQCEIWYVSMTSQIFNIGNYVFLLLSGFLFGVQGELRRPYIHWYKKRMTRIYIPYEMMVVSLFVVYCVLGKDVVAPQWMLQFLGLQGWNGVQGAGHTWFVTSILICYLITPLLSRALKYDIHNIRTAMICVIALAMPVILLTPVIVQYYFVLCPITTYVLAYLLGRNFDKVRLGYIKSVVCLLGICVTFAVRLFGRILWDGTVLYTYIIVTYTHMIAAFCLFAIFARRSGKLRFPIWYINYLKSALKFIYGTICLQLGRFDFLGFREFG